jgi:hypothetical protein
MRKFYFIHGTVSPARRFAGLNFHSTACLMARQLLGKT